MNNIVQDTKPRFLAIQSPGAAIVPFIASVFWFLLNPSSLQFAGIGHDFDFYVDVMVPLVPLIMNLAGVVCAAWPTRARRPLPWWKWIVFFVVVGVAACMLWILSWATAFCGVLSVVSIFHR